ncbi:MAG: hypothetical protein SGJ10_04470 [Bacteroidota bacterium]|nr:hypothetical protein [Bacteroidota bacterium]
MKRFIYSFVILYFAIVIPSKAQTIQGEIPDSVVKKFGCQSIWKVIDASRTQFKSIRGAKKPMKYTSVYQATALVRGTNSAQIIVDGPHSKYEATIIETANGSEATKAYSKFLPTAEICLEGWVFVTEPEEGSNQIYRFIAYEKEDMVSGITVEVALTKSKSGRYKVVLTIQP